MLRKETPGRRSIRLKGYDYSRAGAYFVTMVTHQREYLFGNIFDGVVQLNPSGLTVVAAWEQTPLVRPNIRLGEFVVMPNHLHRILIIDDTNDAGAGTTRRDHDDDGVGAMRRIAPTDVTAVAVTDCIAPPNTAGRPHGAASGSIGAIIGQIKSITTKRINQLRGTPGVPIWQRNFYEHIIRNEAELTLISQYIHANPLNWAEDRENPGI